MTSRRGRARSWWRFSAGEARAHAIVAAVAMWAVAGVIAFAGSGYRSVFGPLKGSDFIQFYTLGHLDERTAPTTLYDPDRFHQLQTELVPESARERYLIVYPPHVTLLFRPFAGLSYGRAALLWAAILGALYGVCVYASWRPFRSVLHDGRLVAAAAAAFPPFWYLVLHGQTTIVPLLAFCLGWAALEARRPFWAGMAFGLLLLKPQFALVLVVLTLIGGEWAIIAGAIVCVALQVTATAALLGTSVLSDYAAMVTRLPQLRDMLAPRPEQMHSISAVTDRLPGDWGALAWAVLTVLIIFHTVRVWRSSAPIAVRMGILVLASVLVNPHVFVYDAAVLAPALIWLAAWACTESSVRTTTNALFAPLIYALYASLLFPTAATLPIQASVFVLGGLLVIISRDLLRSNSGQTSSFNMNSADRQNSVTHQNLARR